MAWTGFTDEQLMQLKQSDDTEQDYPIRSQPRKPAQHGRGGAPRRMHTNRNAAQRGRGPRPLVSSTQQSQPLSPNQMLSTPKEVPSRPRPQQRPRMSSSGSDNSELTVRDTKGKAAKDGKNGHDDQSEQLAQDGLGSQGGKRQQDASAKHDNDTTIQEDEVENKEVVTEELDEKEGISREHTKLELFQEEQKKMEVENKKRKALLAKALADRKKKTQAETRRLAYIQKELGKIDDLLTTDVGILRDRIEDVSREYLEAQKRYQRAEKEFVAAKLHLHKVEDTKDSLTEHLCSIIHENEIRKAKKLEELVTKLEVDNLEEFEKQLEEESNVPKSPITKVADSVPNTTSSESTQSSTSNQNTTSVVIATDQAVEEKPSSDENKSDVTAPSSNGNACSSNTEKNKESQATDANVDVNAEKGAKQESTSSVSSVPVREPGGKEDTNKIQSVSGQKLENNQTVTDPPSVS